MDLTDRVECFLFMGRAPDNIHSEAAGIPDTFGLLWRGRYEEFLRQKPACSILKGENNGKEVVAEDLENFIRENVVNYVSGPDCDSNLRCLEVLGVAVACLQLFVQNNWTGPKAESLPVSFLPEAFQDDQQRNALLEYILASLSCDGEYLYELVISPEYLFIARAILQGCEDQLSVKTADWWLLRCLRLNQEFLDDKSPTIKAAVMKIVDEAPNNPLLGGDTLDSRDVNVLVHVEAGHLCHMFYEYARANQHFETASRTAGLSVEFTGALGKRTRFQEENKPQLALVVRRLEGETTAPSTNEEINLTHLPQDLALNDDTVLETIKFQNPTDVTTATLTAAESVLLCGLMENHRRTSAAEETKEEEQEAFVAAVLSQPRVWPVQLCALFTRSRLQKKSSRRVDRSMRQIEELINLYDKPKPEVCERVGYFYPTRAPSRTAMEAELASILVSLGAFGAACDVYERLRRWEECIACYQRMGKTEKAESLIREQLAVKETPNLYCFLGDVTKDAEWYEKAWALSGHRSARAQRCLGYLFMGKQMFVKSMECFERSLEINTLQIPVWFTYGCAAMAAKQYETAAKAFHRCVSLDYDNFEAWANLSASYAKLEQKPRAFAVLQDALKCSYGNWRLWENTMIIGVDCREFSKVIQAYHQLLDLKGKWVDAEILNILSVAITDDIPDVNERPAGYLRRQALELFGRVTSKGVTDSRVWEAYARLNDSGPAQDADKEKSLQYLKKAHQLLIQETNWEKDVEKCGRVGRLSIKLGQAYSECIAVLPATQSLPLAASAKLMLRSCATKIKQQQIPMPEELREVYQSLEEETEKFAALQTQLKGL